MPEDASLNSGAPDLGPGPWSRVSEMQAKLHRWAAADAGRRFDDLFNFVHVRHEALSVREEVQDLLPCPVAAGCVKLRAA